MAARLFPLAARGLIFLLALSMLWPYLGPFYNRPLVASSGPLAPGGVTILAGGRSISIYYGSGGPDDPLVVKGLALHWGLALVMALVAATPHLGARRYAGWLLGAIAFFSLANGAALTMLARALAWSVKDGPGGLDKGAIFGAFALYLSVLPVLVGGLWCFRYWRPMVRMETRLQR